MSAIGTMAEGDIIQLNENGTPVDFYIAKHDYESGLNGAGRTLVVRKDCYDKRQWHTSNTNAYASSAIDAWLNGTYKALLDADIQAAMGTTSFYYTPGNGNTTVTTLRRVIFLLSMTELGQSHTYANVEGTALPIASTLKIAYYNGAANAQWTRSPNTSNTTNSWRLHTDGNIVGSGCSNTYGSRPAFTLPSTFDPNPTEETITISGADADLGEKSESFSVSYTVTTGSGTAAAVTEKLDSTVLRTITVQSGVEQTAEIHVDGLSAGSHTATITAQIGSLTDTRTYTFTVPRVETLSISGQDGSLGDKTASFTVPYTVTTGTGSAATVTETLDSTRLRQYSAASGADQTASVDISGLTEGSHTVTITAQVGSLTAVRTYTFTIPPKPPEPQETIAISGTDQDLGEKSAAFEISYTVTTGTGSAAQAVEKLDGTTLLSRTVPSGAAQTVTVDPAALTAGPHTVQITATIGGLTAVRTYTFTVPGPAPEETVTISGSSGDLGNKSAPFEIAYSVATGSGNSASVTETLDGASMRTYTAVSGAVQSVSIDPSALSEGAHTFSIQAEAGGVTATRTNAFTVLNDNTPPDDYYQSIYSGEEIDNGVGRALPGGALDESIAKVQQMVGVNLLDNWYFINPVNQRGQTEYSGAGYGIDCWKMYQSQVSLVVQPNGIAIRRSSGDFFAILQYIEDHVKISGKTVTLSMRIKAAPATYRLRIMTGSTVIAQTAMQSAGAVGVISLTAAIPVDLTDLWVTIYISPSTDYFLLEGAKLEIGTRQTLAHQDESGNWVLNEIPDYGTELAKCQRYLIDLGRYARFPSSFIASNFIDFTIPLPCNMRLSAPTIDFGNAIMSSGGVNQTGFTFAVQSATGPYLWVRATKNAHGLAFASLQFNTTINMVSSEL